MKLKKIRVRFPWIQFLSLIVSVLMLGISLWTARYNTSNARSSSSLKINYTASKTQIANADAQPSAGKVHFGFIQHSGTTGTKYAVSYKKSSSSKYSSAVEKNASKNNYYYGSYYLFNSNGSNKYNFKIEKKNNTSKSSNITFDWATL